MFLMQSVKSAVWDNRIHVLQTCTLIWQTTWSASKLIRLWFDIIASSGSACAGSSVEFCCCCSVSSLFVDVSQKMSVWGQFRDTISEISLLYISSPCFLIIFCWVRLHCSKGLNPICCNYLVILLEFQLLCWMNWLCRCLKHEQMNPVKCCQWCVVSHSSTKKLEHIFWQSCSFSQGGYLQSYLCSLWISKWMVNINLWELE